eukprot:7597829-Alexandrium_andersonii.AAC.1
MLRCSQALALCDQNGPALPGALPSSPVPPPRLRCSQALGCVPPKRPSSVLATGVRWEALVRWAA